MALDLPAGFPLAYAFAFAQEGEVLNLAAGAEYPVPPEGLRLTRRMSIKGNGARLVQAETMLPANPVLSVEADGLVEISDLAIIGSRPAGATYYDAELEGNHGIAVRGGSWVHVHHVWVVHVEGDGFYLGRNGDDFARVIRINDSIVVNTGRHGMATIAAEDVLLENVHFAQVRRTGFNFEVHPNRWVRRWTGRNIYFAEHGLLGITMTGSGPVEDVTFDGWTEGPADYFSAQVGTGAPVRRLSLLNFQGGRDDGDPDPQVRLLNVEGLKLRNFPYDVDTTGSTLI